MIPIRCQFICINMRVFNIVLISSISYNLTEGRKCIFFKPLHYKALNNMYLFRVLTFHGSYLILLFKLCMGKEQTSKTENS